MATDMSPIFSEALQNSDFRPPVADLIPKAAIVFRDEFWWRRWLALGLLLDPAHSEGWRHRRTGPNQKWEGVFVFAERENWETRAALADRPTRFEKTKYVALQPISSRPREHRLETSASEQAADESFGLPAKPPIIVFWEPQL